MVLLLQQTACFPLVPAGCFCFLLGLGCGSAGKSVKSSGSVWSSAPGSPGGLGHSLSLPAQALGSSDGFFEGRSPRLLKRNFFTLTFCVSSGLAVFDSAQRQTETSVIFLFQSFPDLPTLNRFHFWKNLNVQTMFSIFVLLV